MRRMMGDIEPLVWRVRQLIDSSMLPSFDEQFERSFWAPPIEAFERDDELVECAALPGTQKTCASKPEQTRSKRRELPIGPKASPGAKR